jgi:hypothetical protein
MACLINRIFPQTHQVPVLITAGAEQSVAIGLMAAELATSGKGALHNIQFI